MLFRSRPAEPSNDVLCIGPNAGDPRRPAEPSNDVLCIGPNAGDPRRPDEPSNDVLCIAPDEAGYDVLCIGPGDPRAHRPGPDEAGYDVLCIGPGPGDPSELRAPKIAALRARTRRALRGGVPLLAVCLGHQVLAGLLGLPPRRRPAPAQGERREIDFFGRAERVGFYNTFAAYSAVDAVTHPLARGAIEVSRDRYTGEVYGLRAPGLRSVQFHPESVLTENGPRILANLFTSMLFTTWPNRFRRPTIISPRTL